MSLHYLLDGYNIIHQIPALNDKERDVKQIELIRLVDSHQLTGSSKNHVTVVFDGHHKPYDGHKPSHFSVRYSNDASADDVIRNMVINSEKSKSFIVVTDDRDIQYAIRAAGAKAVKVAAFLSSSKSKGKKGRSTSTGRSSKAISEGDAQDINEELKKIWGSGAEDDS